MPLVSAAAAAAVCVCVYVCVWRRYMLLFVYLPEAFEAKFSASLGQVVPVILQGLDDEANPVREVALRAGQVPTAASHGYLAASLIDVLVWCVFFKLDTGAELCLVPHGASFGAIGGGSRASQLAYPSEHCHTGWRSSQTPLWCVAPHSLSMRAV